MSLDKKYQKKTILQVVPALISGGVERGTIEIAKSIVRAGHESIVISAGGPMVDSLVDSGSEHIMLNVASKNPTPPAEGERPRFDHLRKSTRQVLQRM